MVQVYLIGAPEDEAHGEALAAWLKQRGHVVRSEYGGFAYPPARPGEVTLVICSQELAMSVKRLQLVNRATDAWEAGRLVLCRYDHALAPAGIADLDMIDLSFEPAREHRYVEVDKALQAAAQPTPQAAAPSDDPGVAPSPPVDVRSPAPQVPARRKGGLFSKIGQVFRGAKKKAADRAPVEREKAERTFPADRDPFAGLPDPTQQAGVAGVSLGDVVGAPDIFVSYAHADRDAVYPIVELVEGMGRHVWIDRDDMKAGQGWAGMIVRAIKSSQTFCIMCSARAFGSSHVRREVYLADKYGKTLLPIRLDDAEMPEDIEYFLIDRQWIDMSAIPEDKREAILREAFST